MNICLITERIWKTSDYGNDKPIGLWYRTRVKHLVKTETYKRILREKREGVWHPKKRACSWNCEVCRERGLQYDSY
jgi:hypothetical protein